MSHRFEKYNMRLIFLERTYYKLSITKSILCLVFLVIIIVIGIHGEMLRTIDNKSFIELIVSLLYS